MHESIVAPERNGTSTPTSHFGSGGTTTAAATAAAAALQSSRSSSSRGGGCPTSWGCDCCSERRVQSTSPKCHNIAGQRSSPAATDESKSGCKSEGTAEGRAGGTSTWSDPRTSRQQGCSATGCLAAATGEASVTGHATGEVECTTTKGPSVASSWSGCNPGSCSSSWQRRATTAARRGLLRPAVCDTVCQQGRCPCESLAFSLAKKRGRGASSAQGCSRDPGEGTTRCKEGSAT